MKLRVILVFVLLLCYIYVSSSVNSQSDYNNKFGEILVEKIEQNALTSRTKFWIYFVDKGSYSEDELFVVKEKILHDFHPKTIQRRLKMKFTTNLHDLIEEEDIPVNKEYIKAITNIKGVTQKTTSNWGNSISISINDNQLQLLKQISQFPFVKHIEIVRAFKKHYPMEETNDKGDFQSAKEQKNKRRVRKEKYTL